MPLRATETPFRTCVGGAPCKSGPRDPTSMAAVCSPELLSQRETSRGSSEADFYWSQKRPRRDRCLHFWLTCRRRPGNRGVAHLPLISPDQRSWHHFTWAVTHIACAGPAANAFVFFVAATDKCTPHPDPILHHDHSLAHSEPAHCRKFVFWGLHAFLPAAAHIVMVTTAMHGRSTCAQTPSDSAPWTFKRRMGF